MIYESSLGAFSPFCGVAAGVLVVVAVTIFFIWFSRTMKDNDTRIAAAFAATAIITDVGHSYTSRIYNNVRVKLTLQITPPQGNPYTATANWWVEPAAIPKIQTGNKVQVKIDAQDKSRIYPNESWAKGY